VVSYVLFDLLFDHGQALWQQALLRRRRRLRELLAGANEPALVYSDGVKGDGRGFFARVVAQGHEGVMAKHRSSRYVPGKRSAAWRKIKPAGMLPCVIIGYQPGRAGIQRLLVATVHEGELRYVGQLRRGLDDPAGVALAQRLVLRRCKQPLVPCPVRACWVEPALYCRVKMHGWTARGHLRDAVFGGLIEETTYAAAGRPSRREPWGDRRHTLEKAKCLPELP
jgi:bifunctional non-homologous end joining protein LigD